MTRYILIDQYTGFIWGDVRDAASPAEAAAQCDAGIGGEPREYDEHGSSFKPDASNAYHVYAAPDGFPLVADGQNEEEIAAVERQCRKVAVVTWPVANLED